MQAEDFPIQTSQFGLGFIPIIPPSRSKPRRTQIRYKSPPQTVSRTASLPSLDPPKTAKAAPLPPVPKTPSTPQSRTVDLSLNFHDLHPDDLKLFLISALTRERELIETLKSRLVLVSKALQRLEPHAEVSLQDVEKLTEVFQAISKSVSHICAVESELGGKQRELEKRNIELASLRRKVTTQTTSSVQNQVESRLLKDKFRELQEQHAHLVKAHHSEKQKFASFFSKLNALEEGMEVLTTTAQGSDAVTKLKSSINALLKELREGKAEVVAKNKQIGELNSQIQRLNKKTSRLSFKLNEIRNRKTSVAEQNHMPEDESHRQQFDPRTLPYRLGDLTEEQRTFANDLLEHGVQAVVHWQEKTLVEMLADKLLQMNEFVDQLHVLHPALSAIVRCGDTRSLIAAVSAEISLVANAEHCYYWVFDRTNDEVWTLKAGQEVRIRSDSGLVGTVIFSNTYLNTTEPRDPAREHLLGYKLHSTLIYPVTSDQVIVGVLEIVNNFVGKFDADEEYLVETLLPAIAETTVKAVQSSTAVRLTRIKEELFRAIPQVCLCQTRETVAKEVETVCCRVFAVDRCRLLLVQGEELVWQSGREVAFISRTMGISGEVSRTQIPELVGDPYNDLRYNSLVDLPSSLPVYFLPVMATVQGLLVTLGVLQLPYKSAVKARVNDRAIRVDGSMASIMEALVGVVAACLQRIRGSLAD